MGESARLADLMPRRQPMFSNTAWKRNGCYKLGAQDLTEWPLERGLTGCTDDWNDLDHFDVTSEMRRVWKRINQIRSIYPVFSDGFSLTERGEWTVLEAPTARGVVRKHGLWSVVRDWLPSTTPEATSVWILYSNKVSRRLKQAQNRTSRRRMDSTVPAPTGSCRLSWKVQRSGIFFIHTNSLR
jgi:hypothetical protein